MKCKECGYELNDGGSYCPGCGVMVEKQEESVQATNDVVEDVAKDVSEGIVSNEVSDLSSEVIQPGYVEEPVEISEVAEFVVPVSVVTESYTPPMNNQEIQPMYNNQPQYNANVQQGTDKKKIVPVIIGIVAVVVLGLIISTSVVVVKLINSGESEAKPDSGEKAGTDNKTGTDSDNKSGSGSNTGTDSGNKTDNGTSTNNSNTYEVKANGYTFNIPNDLKWELDDESIYIYDKNETWLSQIELVDNSYRIIANNKSTLKSNMEKSGFTVRNMVEQNYSGKPFITAELSLSGSNLLVAYTGASLNKSFAVSVENAGNIFDYTTLNAVAPILKSATYTGDSSHMKGNTNIDLGDVVKNITE